MNRFFKAALFAFCAHECAGEVFLRQDLIDALQPVVCQAKNAPSAEKLWDLNVFDTRLSLSIVRPDSPTTDISAVAKQEAQRFGDLGYAFGNCPGAERWILSVPSPAGITVHRDTVTLPMTALSAHCAEIRVDYAGAAGGPSNVLPIVDSKVAFPKNEGTVSVTCQPANTQAQGPKLLALVPVGKPSILPSVEKLRLPATDSPEARLGAWISAIRKQHNLPASAINDEPHLAAAASDLADSLSVDHDRQALQKLHLKLASFGIDFIGEDRGIAATLEDFAWLIWNSGRHRDLILVTKARHFAVKRRNLKDKAGALYVLVAAK